MAATNLTIDKRVLGEIIRQKYFRQARRREGANFLNRYGSLRSESVLSVSADALLAYEAVFGWKACKLAHRLQRRIQVAALRFLYAVQYHYQYNDARDSYGNA